MRVALVSAYSLTRPGGVQSHLLEFAEHLRRRGVDVDLVGPAEGDTPEGVHGVGRSVPFRDSGSVVPVALGPEAIVRTARLVRAGEYDVVHLHEPMLPWVPLTALVAARAPLVGTFHMYAARPRWYRPFGPLCRRLLDRLAVRIAVSEAARRHVARCCPGEYRVIPNGVSLEQIRAVEPRREGRRILFVGRAEPRKGVPQLLEAFARLDGDAELHLAGVEPREVDGERVVAHGRVGPEERNRLLAEADVLVMPSIQGESLPRVILEGMAAGLPVVASAVAGNADVVTDDFGRLVPPADAEALAGALRELLGDDGLRRRLGDEAARRAERYDWERVTDEILAVYEEARQAGTPAAPLRAPDGRPAPKSRRIRPGDRATARRGSSASWSPSATRLAETAKTAIVALGSTTSHSRPR